MLHLLLIGGGEIGAPKGDGTYRPLETLAIDKHFVTSICKKKPKILFIPTATENLDPERTYEQGMISLYGNKLGCEIDTLYLSENPTADDMQQKLLNADAIYIGGGDTAFMLKRWKETGFDKLLKQTAKEGKPIAGLSAGAMCWFDKVVIKENGISKFTNGLGVVKKFCIPHWNKKRNFVEEPIAQNTQFLGIEECATLEIIGKNISIVRSNENANVYQCKCAPNLQETKINPTIIDLPIIKRSFER